MRPASQRFFIHSCIYLRILIISYLATFLGTNSLSVLMCRKEVNQSINQSSVTRTALNWVTDMRVWCLAIDMCQAATSGDYELTKFACRLHTFRGASKCPASVLRTFNPYPKLVLIYWPPNDERLEGITYIIYVQVIYASDTARI